jgi:exodeoxyribonuclease VII large subunit
VNAATVPTRGLHFHGNAALLTSQVVQQSLWSKPSGPEVLTVDEVTRGLKRAVESTFPKVSVEGEVVSAKPSSAGHLYFTLQGRNAALSCVMFRSAVSRLVRPPRDGDHVICTGGVELYERRGSYQLVVKALRQSGEGELLAELEALKKRLHAEGLFDPARKQSLPRFPRRIGIITAHTGAAVRDIVKSVHSRFPVPLLLAAAKVQGVDAATQLRWALEALSSVSDIDVIVIGRGGGSIQDLWSFNDEALARAIAACPVPVVSAVGHEIDTVLTDLVADARAPTPTSVGLLLVPDMADLQHHLATRQQQAQRALANQLRHMRQGLASLARRVADPRRLIRDRMQRIDDASRRLERAIERRIIDTRRRLQTAQRRLDQVHPLTRLARERAALDAVAARLPRGIERALERDRARLQRLEARLQAMSPTRVLQRGYAIARTKNGAVIRSHDDISPGATVEVLLGVGALEATVTRSIPSDEESP